MYVLRPITPDLRSKSVYTHKVRGVAAADFLPAGVTAAAAAAAIFCARRSALLFARGAMVGAWRLLGRGFAGLASFVLPLLVADVVLADVDTEREVEGGGREVEVEHCVLVVVLEAGVMRDAMGRDGDGWTDAAEGGREMEGRAELVPLKDVRDVDREGDCWLAGARTTRVVSTQLRQRRLF